MRYIVLSLILLALSSCNSNVQVEKREPQHLEVHLERILNGLGMEIRTEKPSLVFIEEGAFGDKIFGDICEIKSGQPCSCFYWTSVTEKEENTAFVEIVNELTADTFPLYVDSSFTIKMESIERDNFFQLATALKRAYSKKKVGCNNKFIPSTISTVIFTNSEGEIFIESGENRHQNEECIHPVLIDLFTKLDELIKRKAAASN